MEPSWGYKISSSDFERYRAFFPDLEKSDNFFRPWMDQRLEEKAGEHDILLKSLDRAQTRPSTSRTLQESDFTHSEEAGSASESNVCRREESPSPPSSHGDPRPRRKSSRPHRSAAANDPSFRGVTVSVQTHLSRAQRSRRWQSQLLIKSSFSVSSSKLSRALRTRRRSCCESYEESSSDSDGRRGDLNNRGQTFMDRKDSSPMRRRRMRRQPTTRSYFSHQRPIQLVGYSGKQCASCCARRTPLWRDAEDGTPLCNACGIRYKKYRIRCGGCWLIPRKDGKSFTNCIRCGKEFRMSVFRRSSKQ